MEDGEHIWVQLLDRLQKLLKIVVIPLESFVSDRNKTSLPLPYVLWEENTDVWINVSDNGEFMSLMKLLATCICILVGD